MHVREPGRGADARAPAPGGLARAARGNVIPAGASNILVRTGLARELGGFDERLDHLADWDFWIRLAHAAAAGACDEVLVGYVDHSQNRYKYAGDVLAAEFEYLVEKHRAASAAAGVQFDRARFAARGRATRYLRIDRRMAAAAGLPAQRPWRTTASATRPGRRGRAAWRGLQGPVARDTRIRSARSGGCSTSGTRIGSPGSRRSRSRLSPWRDELCA